MVAKLVEEWWVKKWEMEWELVEKEDGWVEKLEELWMVMN